MLAFAVGCGGERPVLEPPSALNPPTCSGELEDLRTLLGTLAPDTASVAGMHRTLGFDLPALPEGFATTGATPGPVMVVKNGAVGWIAGGHASWIKEDMVATLASPPSARPTLWWQPDSRTGTITELSKDSKGRYNTAPGLPEADVPLVAVHPGAQSQLVIGALRGLSAYGYRKAQLLFSAPLPDGDELSMDPNLFALWHPETGLAPLNFDHDPKELAPVRDCAPAYHLLRALPMMDWAGRVRALAVALPQRLGECDCRADFAKLQGTLVAWLNAGDTSRVPVAITLDVSTSGLDAMATGLESRPEAAWSAFVGDALPR